jgi:hypothetical protein
MKNDKAEEPKTPIQTQAEYIEEMKRSDAQRLKCREFLNARPPKPVPEMVCYHGFSIHKCDSLNCTADSGRMNGATPFAAHKAIQ